MSTLEGLAVAARGIRAPTVTRHVPWTLIAQTVLAVAGLLLFTAAAWLVAPSFGLAVAGGSCLVLEHRVASAGDRRTPR